MVLCTAYAPYTASGSTATASSPQRQIVVIGGLPPGAPTPASQLSPIGHLRYRELRRLHAAVARAAHDARDTKRVLLDHHRPREQRLQLRIMRDDVDRGHHRLHLAQRLHEPLRPTRVQ